MNKMILRIETFSVSPYIGAIIGLLGHTLLLLYSIWFKKFEENTKIIEHKVWKYLKGVFYIFYMFLGILMVDLAVFWLLGQWTYADWRYQLPSVLISLVFGIQYLWGTLIRSLDRYKLLIFSYLLIFTLILLHWYLPANMPIKKSFDIIWLPIFSCIVIYTLIALFGQRYPSIYRYNKEILEIKNLYEKIFTEKVNWVCFFIALFEVWAKFKGSSIFIF